VPKLLSDSEISRRLKALKGWKHEGEFITKVFEFNRFMDGVDFVNRVAAIAEKEEHHPDVHVRYTTITLSMQTHSEGGVTEWDLDLTEAVEKMLRRGESSKNVKRR
jgi:4a-hydroxytetrahydrobiopterin dehydratase